MEITSEALLIDLSFGEWLKRQRMVKGLTREQLAEQIGCATITLRKLEAEQRRPSKQMVERIAKLFEIPQSERAAFLRFTRGDPTKAPTPRSSIPPWKSTVARNNLPTPLSSLVGRTTEIGAVQDYLNMPEVRLVTLLGPPGIGKTRLSLAVAHEVLPVFRDGVFFVPLAALEDASQVALAVARTLGFAEATYQTPAQRILDGIGGKNMLLILDNIEHVIDVIAWLVTDLLSACPRLKILTTSRELIHCPGEWLYPVSSLTFPTETEAQTLPLDQLAHFSALKLFSERARTALPEFALTSDNVQAITMICTRLDGLPLAIELIAARVRLMSPQTLLTHLSSDLILSADGMRAVPARQKTLQNSIGWSYHLLGDKEKCLFRRLAVFAGGWTLQVAQAVCADDQVPPDQIARALAQLVDKSLVIQLEMGDQTRYSMLVTIRQFAHDKGVEARETEVVRQRHLAYFAELAERAEPHLRAFDMVMWLDRLEVELDNIRAALGWAQEGVAEWQLRLASNLLWFWHIRGYLAEATDWLERALRNEALERGGQPPSDTRALLRGKALYALAWLQEQRGNYFPASQFWRESLALLRKLGPLSKQVRAYVLLYSRNDGLGITHCRRVFEQMEDKFGIAECLYLLALLALGQGEIGRAKTLLEEHLALRHKIGDQDGIALGYQALGNLAIHQGDYALAKTLLEQSVTGFRTVGNKSYAAYMGDLELGRVAWLEGSLDKAVEQFEASLAAGHERNAKFETSGALYGLGQVAKAQSRFEMAFEFHSKSLKVRREMSNGNLICRSLVAIAILALAREQQTRHSPRFEQLQRMVQILGTTDATYQRLRYSLSPSERDEYVQAIATLRAALGQEAFTRAYEAGKQMTLDEAIRYALEENDD